MNLGELFFSLGINGGDKALGTLLGVKSALTATKGVAESMKSALSGAVSGLKPGDTAAMTGLQRSLAETASKATGAKAALAGVGFAISRLFATPGTVDEELVALNSLIGVSTQTLQQYRNAAHQAGVANQEVEGTFKSLQSMMAKALAGENVGKGAERLQEVMGRFGPADLERFAEKPQELLQLLQKYAGAEKSLPLRNETLRSFGLSDKMIGAVTKKAFTQPKLEKAPKAPEVELPKSPKKKNVLVDVAVKGADKATDAFSNIQKGLKGISSTTFETKAALIGAMYAAERLFATSGKTGTGLTNFGATVGVSAQVLQQYQYAARQAGVTNEETEATFKALQSTLTKTLMGEGAPKGLARVSMLTGGMTAADLKRFAEQPQLLMQKLQEYAKKETNAGLRREVLSSFGVGEGMQAGFQRKAFTPEVLAKAPTYSEGEVKSLDKSNVAWSNLGTKIEMAVGHFNAAHGGKLVSEISPLIDKLLALAGAFEKLAEKAEVFKLIGMAIQGWTSIFQGATDAVKAIDQASSDPKKADSIKDNVKGFFTEDMPNLFTQWSHDLFDKVGPEKKAEAPRSPRQAAEAKAERATARAAAGGTPGKAGELGRPGQPGQPGTPGKAGAGGKAGAAGMPGAAPKPLSLVPDLAPALPSPAQIAAPAVPPGSSDNSKTTNVEVKQTLNFQHDGKDAQRTSDSVKQAVKQTYRQLSAQGQGT